MEECDFERQANLVYNRQFRDIGRLLGDENMEFDEIRGKVEDLILEGSGSIGGGVNNNHNNNVNINNNNNSRNNNNNSNKEETTKLMQEIERLKSDLMTEKNAKLTLIDRAERYEMK